MVKIFLETQNNRTPEHWFYKTLLMRLGITDSAYELIHVDGKDNLFNVTNRNLMSINSIEGGTNLVIFDADFEINGGGYYNRVDYIEKCRTNFGLSFELFLMPNNSKDGDFETMIEAIARKDLHQVFFDCYSDYEKCIEGPRDTDGTQKYFAPNLKGKLHTYITSMKMSKTQSKKVRGGNWQFDNKDYWDIDDESLEPLKNFLIKYL